MKRNTLKALKSLKEQYKERSEGFENKNFFYAGVISGIEKAISEIIMNEEIEEDEHRI
ncbi:hypothetical protein ST39-O_gp33 [Clostridium phage phiCP39-O]|jgi:hypothetical protein|uniref:hypothetical protein n=1 Tax=Clostridium phage phiCP39-O TaxID=541865 RepID=UPI000181BD01|nr:hypothetical protein ST39-O_gp33 [Clostridium phage phiCP39-O]ACE82015.1 hypothetical protein [Clostridium phage phiCP39-O]AYR04307.1 hypothetical protein CPD1_028 [Clostridium phage CPD1]QYC53120.1 hypothetical protein [Clostridium phage CPQ4]UIS73965.1 hypothetical protein [Clostridium phage vB_CpeP_PMQ04]